VPADDATIGAIVDAALAGDRSLLTDSTPEAHA
jgi:hypothetical protein